MARVNLSTKPLARQVLDRELPSVTAIERDVALSDTGLSVSDSGSPEEPAPTTAPCSAPSADAPARVRRRRTGGRPRRGTDDSGLDQPITRGYVAQILGVDVSTVRRLEVRGQLHPRIGAGGIRYFDRRELRRLMAHRIRTLRHRPSEIRLAAFELFREGIDWRDVAIKLRYDPYRVHRLWRLYAADEKLEPADDGTS